MKRSLILRLVIFMIAVGLGLYMLFPTMQVWFGNLEGAEEMAIKTDKRKPIINLGLDLVGGMHIVLEVDTTGRGLSAEETQSATNTAIDIIRDRVDKYGMTSIQRVGKNRIQVQLPEIKDREGALRLIGSTGKLEFLLVESAERTMEVFDAIDRYILGDTIVTSRPFSALLEPAGYDAAVSPDNYETLKSMLADAGEAVPADVQVLFGEEEELVEGTSVRSIRRVYVLKKIAQLTGDDVDGEEVKAKPYEGRDPQYTGTWMVEMGLQREGQLKFAEVTGNNVGSRLAIVLDSEVKSAPVIRERIPPGAKASITSVDRVGEDTHNLADIIAHGALPMPLKIIEERTVSPTLGRDSISSGVLAILIGLAAVVLFMIIYYTGSGAIAILALVFNLFFLLAILAGFRTTFTLSGLAGIALTIGMAVDANVLIYERIRDELRAGKFPRSAVQIGYSQAAKIIIDANITTIIAAIVLYAFNKGPVKGFAWTLIWGLVVNMFTAVYLSRGIFDLYLFRRPDRKLFI